MPTLTPNFSFNLPTTGADTDIWGGLLNANFTAIDGLLSGGAPIAPNLVGWKVGGTIVTASGAELNKLAGTPVGLTATELGFLDGVTSAIQPQLDARVGITHGIVTAGTDAQGQGAMTGDQNTVTTTAANPSGVTLPTATAGKRVLVANRGTNPINVYPATGARIGSVAVNVAVSLQVGQTVEFFARSATQWEGQISQPYDADLTDIAALADVRGDLLLRGTTAWGRLPIGPAGSVLISDGTDAEWGAASGAAAGVALTGSAVNLSTVIPDSARQIAVSFRNLSTDGSASFGVQVSDGTFITTGYVSDTYMGTIGGTSGTTRFVLASPVTAGENYYGSLILSRQAGDFYFLHGVVYRSTGICWVVGGFIQVTGGITGIRMVGGGDSFDAGTGYVSWI